MDDTTDVQARLPPAPPPLPPQRPLGSVEPNHALLYVSSVAAAGDGGGAYPADVAALWRRWFPERGRVGDMPNAGELRDVCALTNILFGDDAALEREQVLQRYLELTEEFARVARGVPRESPAWPQCNHVLRLVASRIEIARYIVDARCAVRMSAASASSQQPVDAGRFARGAAAASVADEKHDIDEKGIHRILRFIMEDVASKGWRRCRTDFVEPVVSVDGHPTAAWRPVKSFERYMHELYGRYDTKSWLWKDLVSCGTKRPIEYLETAQCAQMPWVERDRHVFSFRNGTYDVKRELFVRNVDLPAAYAGVAMPVACNHFDVDVDEADLNIAVDEAHPAKSDWFDIPTPAFTRLLTDQKMSESVQRILYALLGRCLYFVRELDDWQVFIMLKGVGGTGKSCILRAIHDLFMAGDVGVISNNIERQFGLSVVHDKLLGIADDLRENFQLDQSDYQNMCSGMAVSVARKCKTPVVCDPWRVPIISSGNVLMGYSDNGGSFSRRTVIFSLPYPIKEQDASIPAQLVAERAHFLLKINRAYRNLLREIGNRGIWSVMPQEIVDARRDVGTATNSLVNYLSNSGEFFRSPNAFVPLQEFRDKFMLYAKSIGFSQIKWTKDFYSAPFYEAGIEVSLNSRHLVYPRKLDGGGGAGTALVDQRNRRNIGKTRHCFYLLGIDFASASPEVWQQQHGTDGDSSAGQEPSASAAVAPPPTTSDRFSLPDAAIVVVGDDAEHPPLSRKRAHGDADDTSPPPDKRNKA